MPTEAEAAAFAARMKPWTRRFMEVIADGRDHEWDEALFEAMALVPPGIAYRAAEEARARYFRKKHGPDAALMPRQRGDMQDAIASGQRALVLDSLVGLRKRGKIIVTEHPDGRKTVRVPNDADKAAAAEAKKPKEPKPPKGPEPAMVIVDEVGTVDPEKVTEAFALIRASIEEQKKEEPPPEPEPVDGPCQRCNAPRAALAHFDTRSMAYSCAPPPPPPKPTLLTTSTQNPEAERVAAIAAAEKRKPRKQGPIVVPIGGSADPVYWQWDCDVCGDHKILLPDEDITAELAEHVEKKHPAVYLAVKATVLGEKEYQRLLDKKGS